MSAADYPVVMCDDDSGCEEWALDHTLHGLATLVGSDSQLPDGWTGDRPGTGLDEQFCPAHARLTPPAEPDPWCREETCRYRHWQSGSMPTHRRGSDCPPPSTSPAEQANQ